MEWDASTVAVLIGAAIGGLSGVAGQIVAVLLRRRGEIRHQNRLLLQETYVEALRGFNRIQYAFTTLKVAANEERFGKDYVRRLESVTQELRAMVVELRPIAAMVYAVGSEEVADGIVETLGWVVHALDAILQKGTPAAERNARIVEAADRGAEWVNWTIKSVSADFRVDGARRPRKKPPPAPETATEPALPEAPTAP